MPKRCLRLSSWPGEPEACWISPFELGPQRGATEEEQAKYSKRSVRVTREQNEDCKRLLRLAGGAHHRGELPS